MKPQARRDDRIPRLCYWEITRACNHRCIHCINRSGSSTSDELKPSECRTVSNALSALGCESVNLTGGEPLLRSDWTGIAQTLAGHGIHVVIVSNGYLVDEKLIQKMIDCGVQGLAISLDGDRQAHNAVRRVKGRRPSDSFTHAMRALELAAASPLKAAAITQVHKNNIGTLGWIYKTLAALTLDAWQIQAAIPLGRLLDIRHEYLLEPRQIPELEESLALFIDDGKVPIRVADNIGYYGKNEPKLRVSITGQPMFWTGCRAGMEVLSIGPAGEIKGCPSQPREFARANLRETPLEEIWNEPNNFAYSTARKEELLEGECSRCSFRNICKAGCSSMAYAFTGTVYDNPFCIQRVRETS